MNWNIGEFSKLAEKHLAPQVVASLQLPLLSVRWKFLLCQYHVAESNRILSEPFTWDEDRQVAEAVGKILMQAAGTNEGREFAKASFCAEAHAIAFAQSLHSTADTLAQILCISLRLSLKKRNLHSAVQYLCGNGIAHRVAVAATTFQNSDEFRYLRAYVNTTKHISLVPSSYSVGLIPGQERHGLKVAAFDYDRRHWPEKWISDFMGADFEKLSSLFGAIGTELNEHIRSLP